MATLGLEEIYCKWSNVGDPMKKKKAKVIKARVNPQGLMGLAPRAHKPKKGKGSYVRKPKRSS